MTKTLKIFPFFLTRVMVLTLVVLILSTSYSEAISYSQPPKSSKSACPDEIRHLKSYDRDELGYPILSHDGLPRFLDGHLVSVPPRRFAKAMHSIQVAERLFRRALGPGASPHMSHTHSWYDVMVQIMSVIWHFEDKKAQIAVAYAVMALHLLDDLADHGEGATALASTRWDRPSLIWPLLDISTDNELTNYIYHLIGKASEHLSFYRSEHRKLLEFGIRRMLEGSPIFSATVEMAEIYIGNHLNEIVRILPHNSRLRKYIKDRTIHPFTVALSIKPLYETIDALSLENPNVHDSLLKSLFLGSLVYVHNADAEKNSGESHAHAHVTHERLIHDMKAIGDIIRTMEPGRRRQIILSFPAAIESSHRVLRKNDLLDFYVEFLKDRAIRPYLHPEIDLDAFFKKLGEGKP